MRSRLLGLSVLAAVALPTAATSGPYDTPEVAFGVGIVVPGAVVAFDAVALNPPPLIPCAGCGTIGQVTILSEDGHPWRASVTCLAVTEREAFMGLTVLEGDLLVDAAAYARQASDGSEPTPGHRFSMLRGVPFNCLNESVRGDLRRQAHLLGGVVVVQHVCEFCD